MLARFLAWLRRKMLDSRTRERFNDELAQFDREIGGRK
jgi:hypothetical protein